ncbi:hypothetical protein DTO207G8_4620 [Paecilomyces variotii]|nr:hypothetical protein DTO169C6_1758 [Paecilomyces variotii]KAJ9252834.1 hypothetical protein DTO207G8_4620 [Paecilomyces variotii]
MSNYDVNKLPVLSGADNYRSWRNRLRVYLTIEELWRIVDGTKKDPAELYPDVFNKQQAGISTMFQTEEENALRKEKDDWDEKNNKAMNAICRTLSKAIFDEVRKRNFEYAAEIWTYLEKYDVVSGAQSLEGLKTAMRTHYSTCKDVQEYIHKMQAAIQKIKRSLSGEPWPEALGAQFLLCNLDEKWDTFMIVFLNSEYKAATATFDSVATRLIQEERRVKFNSEMSSKLIKAQKGKQNSRGNRSRGGTPKFCK